MKKTVFFLFFAIALTASAQKPKLAVYMTGDDPINEIVSNRLVDDLARDNEYTTVERTASFLAALSKEHNYERSGEVNDEQIAALGKQFNVQYVCVASVLDVWGEEKYITARIIDAETAEVVASGSSNGSMQNSSQLIGALNTLSNDFLKAMHYNKQSNAKKVAVYVTKTGNRDVDIVLGDQLVAGFANSGRYAAIERTGGFLQKIKEEQGYQQSGAVDDDDLTRLGQQFGVHYVCVVKTTAWAGDYFISTRMIDVKTGEVANSSRVEGAKLSNSQNVVQVAQRIATELSKGTFAEQAEEARIKAENEARAKAEWEKMNAKYVDLGLPSGTIWRTANEAGFYRYSQAVSEFGQNLPSESHWQELLDNCTWVLENNNYRVIGKNGNSMLLPSVGLYDCEKGIRKVGVYASYLSSTPCGGGDSKALSWDLTKTGKEEYQRKPIIYVTWRNGCLRGSVRCIK